MSRSGGSKKSRTVTLTKSPGNPMYKPKSKPKHGGKGSSGHLPDMKLRKSK